MSTEKKKSDQFFCAALDVVTRLCEGPQVGQGSDVVGELYSAGVCGVLDQVLGLKMGSNLCCESCLRALCSMLCAKVSLQYRYRHLLFHWFLGDPMTVSICMYVAEERRRSGQEVRFHGIRCEPDQLSIAMTDLTFPVLICQAWYTAS